jgi:hypothetical protein
MAKSCKINAAGAATGQINAVREGSERPPEGLKIVLRPLESPIGMSAFDHTCEQY